MIQVAHFNVAVLATLCLCLLCPVSPAVAQYDEANEARTLMDTASLQVVLHVQLMDQFMQYKGSNFEAPTLVWINYKHNNGEKWTKDRPYEQLWLHKGKLVGMKRYSDLPKRQDVIIYVTPFDRQNDQTRSVAKALISLLLDLIIGRSSLRTAYVPKDIYNQTVQDLEEFNFRKMTGVLGGKRPIVLHLASDPPNLQDYFYYTGGESPN
jgi:hypothetical protein